MDDLIIEEIDDILAPELEARKISKLSSNASTKSKSKSIETLDKSLLTFRNL